MTNILWAAVLFLGYLIGAHANEACELSTEDFSDIQSILRRVQDDYSPKMTLSFTLNKDCTYQSDSEITLHDDGPLSTLLGRKVMNPEFLIQASEGAMKKINFEEKPSFIQHMEANKYTLPVKIDSECIQTYQSTVVTSSCQVKDAKVRVGIKGISKSFNLFEKHRAIVTCRVVSTNTKTCHFTTQGRAKSLPIKGACDMAETGALEGFTATYKLAQIINYGALDKNKIKAGVEYIKSALDRAESQNFPVILPFTSVP